MVKDKMDRLSRILRFFRKDKDKRETKRKVIVFPMMRGYIKYKREIKRKGEVKRKVVVFPMRSYIKCPECNKLIGCVFTDFSDMLGIIAPGFPNARCPICEKVIGRLEVNLRVFC